MACPPYFNPANQSDKSPLDSAPFPWIVRHLGSRRPEPASALGEGYLRIEFDQTVRNSRLLRLPGVAAQRTLDQIAVRNVFPVSEEPASCVSSGF